LPFPQDVHVSTLYWFNTGFDVQFAGPVSARFRSRIELMTFLGVMVANAGDAVLVSGAINRDWLKFLRGQGLPLPRLVHEDELAGCTGVECFVPGAGMRRPWSLWPKQVLTILIHPLMLCAG
jgi:hypothetical protein